MNISKSLFGEFEGRSIDLYSLENDRGMTVKITNYGGTVTSIVVPDRDGTRSNVVCGFDTLDGYFRKSYKANTSDDLKREDGTQFGQFRAFCCETSKYPNGPNIPGSPGSILEPGQTYDETTVFRFRW